MQEWRPDGWKRLPVTNNPLHCFNPQECADSSFEAGASAMLRALRQTGMVVAKGWKHLEFDALAQEEGGVIVIIPDDPQEEKK